MHDPTPGPSVHDILMITIINRRINIAPQKLRLILLCGRSLSVEVSSRARSHDHDVDCHVIWSLTNSALITRSLFTRVHLSNAVSSLIGTAVQRVGAVQKLPSEKRIQ